ncbi:universal stress protein [Flavobacterium xinjiangense]|jgi:nucleotide-binding universal stress UspA family protein|uniref:Nucleotide-binding universal stress protein, UspA family n=1 Tax=Flavobacterium xinjiangense TaxID=178356 RepID=A0A1M7JW74_9FLAO|nr:universal stress protein [Flavobacterium xinjiangense]SHM57161.1 Nucleotide-binding universal stress protein, UspA family [Flavobacterium xinjiangense]
MDNMKKILIAVDNDPTSEKIALNGFQLASQLNAEIALLSVVDLTMLITEGAVTPKEFADITINDYKKNQQMLIDTVFKDYKVCTFVEEGIPHEVILKVAQEWDANIIVLGTHGRTGISHLIMGSVAEKIVRHSEIPVFIIPSKS